MNHKYIFTYYLVIIIVILSAVVDSCSVDRSLRRHKYSSARPSQTPRVSDILFITGISSYYGKKFHGRKTANGETFNMYDLTAAHKTLPFGTMLEVENLANNKKVTVRINDRGPFVHNRILDLSFAAAQKIDMIQTGTAQIRAKIIESPKK